MRQMCVLLSMIVDIIYFPVLIDTLIPHQEYVRNQKVFPLHGKESENIHLNRNIIFNPN